MHSMKELCAVLSLLVQAFLGLRRSRFTFRACERAPVKHAKKRVSVCDILYVKFHLNTVFLHVLHVLYAQFD